MPRSDTGAAQPARLLEIREAMQKEQDARLIENSSNHSTLDVQAETVDVLVPIKNESQYLPILLGQLQQQTVQPRAIYLIVAPSDDDTLRIAEDAVHEYENVHVLMNSGGSAAEGMNLGLSASTADSWIRIDGHTEIPRDLIEILRSELIDKGVACVGPLLSSGAKSARQHAIGIAMSSPLGVGGARFRTGAGAPGPTDAVAFGLYRSAVTERVGMFNENMVRNQDDEYNTRLRKRGETIWLTHSVAIKYYPRDSFRKLAGQYMEYGYWRIIGTVEYGNQIRLRQLVPAALILSVGGGVVAGLVMRRQLPGVAPIALYSLAPALQFLRSMHARESVPVSFQSAIAVVVLHSSYGIGSLSALVRVARRRVRSRTCACVAGWRVSRSGVNSVERHSTNDLKDR